MSLHFSLRSWLPTLKKNLKKLSIQQRRNVNGGLGKRERRKGLEVGVVNQNKSGNKNKGKAKSKSKSKTKRKDKNMDMNMDMDKKKGKDKGKSKGKGKGKDKDKDKDEGKGKSKGKGKRKTKRSMPLIYDSHAWLETTDKPKIIKINDTSDEDSDNDDDNYKNEDNMHVVDGLNFIKQGSIAMILDWMEKPIPLSKERKEWHYCRVSEDNTRIYLGHERVILIKDIERIEPLNDDQLQRVKEYLKNTDQNNNDEGFHTDMNLLSLKCLMFAIHFKSKNYDMHESSVYYLLWDNYQIAYIWYQVLKMLIQMRTTKSFNSCMQKPIKKQMGENNNEESELSDPISSYPLLVSDRLRIGTRTLLDFMSNHNDSNTTLLHFIYKQFPSIIKDIDITSQFASKFCILDSSLHLSLLSQAKELIIKSNKITQLLNTLKKDACIDYDQIDELRELWQCLLADFTACSLKYKQLKLELNLTS